MATKDFILKNLDELPESRLLKLVIVKRSIARS
jgi:hypothetical protein